MKPWWQSKTLWLNAIAAGLVALDAVLGPLIKDHTTAVYVGLSIFLAIANAMLRVITTQAITTEQKTQPEG